MREAVFFSVVSLPVFSGSNSNAENPFIEDEKSSMMRCNFFLAFMGEGKRNIKQNVSKLKCMYLLRGRVFKIMYHTSPLNT